MKNTNTPIHNAISELTAIAQARKVDSIKTNAIAANRASFEWGFRMGEKGFHNLESALAEFDKIMKD